MPEPTANSNEEPDRRAQLVDAARKRFVTDGYNRTPVSAIVADVGVAQGTFYIYFKSKQDLIADLRREVFRDYATAFGEVAKSDAAADERIARTLFVMADAVRRNRELERVFRTAESAETIERDGIEGRSRLAAGVAELLEEAIAEGSAERLQDTQFTAYFAVTLFERVLYEALEYEVPADLETVVEEGVRFALGAMGVPADRIDELIESKGE